MARTESLDPYVRGKFLELRDQHPEDDYRAQAGAWTRLIRRDLGGDWRRPLGHRYRRVLVAWARMATAAEVAAARTRPGLLSWIAVALVAMAVVILVVRGVGEPGVREVVRWTARTSLVFFCLGFGAPALPPSSWLARQRAGLLASLAVSHGLHAVAIGWLALLTQGANLVERSGLVTAAGGLLAYAVILAAGFQPNHRIVRLGLFWVWAAFFFAYLPRATQWPLAYGPAVALLATALAVRIAGALRTSGDGAGSLETSHADRA